MLLAAAASAKQMPNLKTMEIWNGENGVAMLFRYQAERGRPALITCRGTWELTLRRPVLQAWDSVAPVHHGKGHVVITELLDAGVYIGSHGDAIHHLKPSRPAVRPVSLRQIRTEGLICEGVQSW